MPRALTSCLEGGHRRLRYGWRCRGWRHQRVRGGWERRGGKSDWMDWSWPTAPEVTSWYFVQHHATCIGITLLYFCLAIQYPSLSFFTWELYPWVWSTNTVILTNHAKVQWLLTFKSLQIPGQWKSGRVAVRLSEAGPRLKLLLIKALRKGLAAFRDKKPRWDAMMLLATNVFLLCEYGRWLLLEKKSEWAQFVHVETELWVIQAF